MFIGIDDKVWFDKRCVSSEDFCRFKGLFMFMSEGPLLPVLLSSLEVSFFICPKKNFSVVGTESVVVVLVDGPVFASREIGSGKSSQVSIGKSNPKFPIYREGFFFVQVPSFELLEEC